MPGLLTRRGLTAGTAAMLGAGVIPARGVTEPAISSIEQRRGGRLGVFVLETGTRRTLVHRADERFLMCSTFKGVLAALVLSRVDAGRDALTTLVPYSQKDIVGHSPVTAANVAHAALSVEALAAASVLYSDNGAANLLLARIGGPAALTEFARGLGDPVTRFDRYEPFAIQRSGALDTTTPRAFVALAQAILLGDALRPQSRARLEGWMIECRTGVDRLRAAFPRGWTVGDKTGTGDGECNDYAIVRRAGRAPLIMAAYHDAPTMPIEAQEAVLRDVGAAIVGWAG